MKTLILARSGRGKDYLRKLLETNYGWRFVKSRTTRPPRFEGEDTHIFISQTEADAVSESDIIAKTEINGYVYFATKEDLEQADAYIIDPNGVEYLFKHYPQEWYELYYIQTDANIAREKAAARADDPEKELVVFDARAESEDDQFTAFEAMIENQSFKSHCAHGIHVIHNDYKPDTLLQAAVQMEFRRRFYEHMPQVLSNLIERSVITSGDGTVELYHHDTDTPIRVRKEMFIQMLAEEPKESMFSMLMEMYMTRYIEDGIHTCTSE